MVIWYSIFPLGGSEHKITIRGKEVEGKKGNGERKEKWIRRGKEREGTGEKGRREWKEVRKGYYTA